MNFSSYREIPKTTIMPDKKEPISAAPASVPAAPVSPAPTTPEPIKQPERKPLPPRKSDRQLRVNFTKDEILEKSKKLAEAHGERVSAENELSAIKSQFKSKIERIETTIGELSGQVVAGWQYKTVEVETTYHDPKPKQKTTRRLDLNEIVEVDDMNAAEMQAELDLQPKEPDVKAGVASDGTVVTAADKGK